MNGLTTDNRDMQAMEEYYLARIAVLEQRITDLEKEAQNV